MKSVKEKDHRQKILGALFIEAGKRGIPQDQLRNEIAPGLIRKRLSKANGVEIGRVLDHICGKKKVNTQNPKRKRYPSSLEGLKEEIVDIAKQRYGDDFEGKLNALCRRFGVRHYKWLDVTHAKAIKARLIEMQADDMEDAL